ncbi:hypothetical protein EJB05_46270, partial [Eragrostis curvula]
MELPGGGELPDSSGFGRAFHKSRVEHLRWRLGLKNCFGVDSEGLSGGLALFCHESISVNLIKCHRRYIDLE